MRKLLAIGLLAIGLSGCRLHFTPCLTPQDGWDYKGHSTGLWVDEKGNNVAWSDEEDTCLVPIR